MYKDIMKRRKENSKDNEQNCITKRSELNSELQVEKIKSKHQNKIWREKIMSLNLTVIMKNLEVAWHIFDRALDDKDYSISTLLDELKCSNEQRKRGTTVHLDEIDHLLEIQKKQLKKFETFYRFSIKNSFELICDQIDTIQQERKQKENFLQIVTLIKNQVIEESTENIKTKNLSKLDTCKEEDENLQKFVVIMLKHHLHNFSEELKSIVRDYEQNIKDRSKDLKVIEIKDIEDQRITTWQSTYIEKLFEIMQKLKNKIINFQFIAKKEIEDYISEQNYFRKAYMLVQDRLKIEQILDKEQIRITNKEYNVTTKYLEGCVTKLGKILTVVNLCQKYERFEDKIILYPISLLIYEIKLNIPTSFVNINGSQNAVKQFQPLQKLLNFIVVMKTDMIKLKHKLQKLNKESNCLKSHLKFYMEIVSDSRTIPLIKIQRFINEQHQC